MNNLVNFQFSKKEFSFRKGKTEETNDVTPAEIKNLKLMMLLPHGQLAILNA